MRSSLLAPLVFAGCLAVPAENEGDPGTNDGGVSAMDMADASANGSADVSANNVTTGDAANGSTTDLGDGDDVAATDDMESRDVAAADVDASGDMQRRCDMVADCEPLVTRVQTVTAALSGGSTTTETLDPFDTTAAVPFASVRSESGRVADTAFDIELTGDEVVVSRDGEQLLAQVEVSVVEFDSDRVAVETGSFSGHETKGLSGNFPPAETFVIHAYASADTGFGRDDAFTTAQLTGANEIVFAGEAAAPSVGHYWAARSLDGAFEVQHLPGSIPMGTSSTVVDIPTAVNVEQTFLIYSSQNTEPNGKSSKGHVSCAIRGPTEIECSRDDNDKDITEIVLQVVEVRGATVQRGMATLDGTMETTGTPVNAVDPSRSHAWCGVTGAHGAHRSNQTTDEEAGNAYATCQLRPGGTGVDFGRNAADNLTTNITWEVIEWP